MDFIVLGGMLGAVMMVVGTVMGDVIPRRFPTMGDDTPWVDVRGRRRTVRTLRAVGRISIMVGLLILAVTVVLVLVDAGDGTAWATVVGVTVVLSLAAIAWTFWFRYQESTGAIQRRQLRAIRARLGPANRPSGAEVGPTGTERRRLQAGTSRGDRERRSIANPSPGSARPSHHVDRDGLDDGGVPAAASRSRRQRLNEDGVASRTERRRDQSPSRGASHHSGDDDPMTDSGPRPRLGTSAGHESRSGRTRPGGASTNRLAPPRSRPESDRWGPTPRRDSDD